MKQFFIAVLSITIICTAAQAQVKKTSSPVKKTTTPVKKEATASTTKPVVSKERLIEITTNYGVMIARLYDSTPLHRDNFIKLVQQKFYDSLLFHRVIKGFMIQGGDPNSKNASPDAQLGFGSAPGERVPAEFRNNFFHKKGALAAASDGNPEKASNNCQFYIVQGNKIDTAQLRQQHEPNVKQNNPKFKYSKQQKEIYQRIGGYPPLDQNYTVFGEVISGLNVLDKIANVQTKPGDRPVSDVMMKIRLLN